MSAAPGPLSGVRVTELSRGQAARMAGLLLAGLGADVTRVAAPGSAPEDLAWDRGKRFAASAPEAGVLLSDGPRAELDAVSARVRVWLPPHTASGRFADLPDDPVLRTALGGFAAYHPSHSGAPVASAVPTFTAVHGALGAAAAAAGLVGGGGTVTVTGLHAMAACLASMAITGLDVDEVASTGWLPGPANFRTYQAGDGRWLHLAALSPDFFFRALDALDRMEIMALPGIDGEFTSLLVPATGAAAGTELEKTFAGRPCDEWIAVLREAGVPAAPVWTRDEWLASTYHDAPVTIDHPDLGPVTTPDVPVRLTALPVPGNPASAAAPAPASGGTGGPLSGLKVIDLSTFLAAPFAAAILADHGAEVVKAERPSGDPYHVFTASYAVVNQAKTITETDLRDPAGRQAFLDQLAGADVLIDNTSAAAMDRLGLGDETIAAASPALVRCSVSAFGREGEHASLPGFDPVLQSLSGLAAAQGGTVSDTDGVPAATSAPMHDVGTSALAAFGILAGLYARSRDGRGRHVTASLAATAGFLQQSEMTTYDGRPPAPEGGRDYPGPTAAHRLHATSDGWIAVAATTEEQVAALLSAAGAASPDALAAAFAARPAAHWLGELAAAGVPACPVIARDRALWDPALGADCTHVIRDPSIGRLRVARGYADWD
ncbi:MAG: CoA transferase [Streptosporangiales bacterium]|nr:CoA transferase [Streptosporangiales bacterium]